MTTQSFCVVQKILIIEVILEFMFILDFIVFKCLEPMTFLMLFLVFLAFLAFLFFLVFMNEAKICSFRNNVSQCCLLCAANIQLLRLNLKNYVLLVTLSAFRNLIVIIILFKHLYI